MVKETQAAESFQTQSCFRHVLAVMRGGTRDHSTQTIHAGVYHGEDYGGRNVHGTVCFGMWLPTNVSQEYISSIVRAQIDLLFYITLLALCSVHCSP